MLVDFGPRLGLGVQEEMILEAEQVRIRQDTALSAQEEGVAALARLERFHLVGGHCVQQPRPVFATGANLAAAGQIEPRGALPQSRVSVRCYRSEEHTS